MHLLHCFLFLLPFHHETFHNVSAGRVKHQHVQAVTQSVATMSDKRRDPFSGQVMCRQERPYHWRSGLPPDRETEKQYVVALNIRDDLV